MKFHNLLYTDPRETRVDKATKDAIKNFRKRRADGITTSRALHEPETRVEAIKMRLCRQFVILNADYEIRQTDLAAMAKVSKYQMNEIIKYRIERFTIDFLITALENIEHSITVDLAPVALRDSPTKKLFKKIDGVDWERIEKAFDETYVLPKLNNKTDEQIRKAAAQRLKERLKKELANEK